MVLKSIQREKIYTPEFNDNKKQKPEDQIKVHITRFPSGGEIGSYRTFRRKGDMTEIVYANIDMMVKHVGKIENLAIDDYKIDDAVKLCDYDDSRLYGLIVEVRNYLLSEGEDLSEGE